MKSLICAMSCLTLMGCGPHLIVASDNSPLSQAEQDAADLILDLTPWVKTLGGAPTGNEPFTLSDVHEYLDAAEALAALTNAEIENVYEAVWNDLDGYGVDPEVGDYTFFVLWRLVAEVPASAPQSSMKFQAPHAAPYDRSWLSGTVRMYPADYPLVLNTLGKVTQIESLLGAKGAYLCWSDFQELVATYGRRTLTEVAALRP